jgi:hypothetical protein
VAAVTLLLHRLQEEHRVGVVQAVALAGITMPRLLSWMHRQAARLETLLAPRLLAAVVQRERAAQPPRQARTARTRMASLAAMAAAAAVRQLRPQPTGQMAEQAAKAAVVVAAVASA